MLTDGACRSTDVAFGCRDSLTLTPEAMSLRIVFGPTDAQSTAPMSSSSAARPSSGWRGREGSQAICQPPP